MLLAVVLAGPFIAMVTRADDKTPSGVIVVGPFFSEMFAAARRGDDNARRCCRIAARCPILPHETITVISFEHCCQFGKIDLGRYLL